MKGRLLPSDGGRGIRNAATQPSNARPGVVAAVIAAPIPKRIVSAQAVLDGLEQVAEDQAIRSEHEKAAAAMRDEALSARSSSTTTEGDGDDEGYWSSQDGESTTTITPKTPIDKREKTED
jgi:hypothetical protein